MAATAAVAEELGTAGVGSEAAVIELPDFWDFPDV